MFKVWFGVLGLNASETTRVGGDNDDYDQISISQMEETGVPGANYRMSMSGVRPIKTKLPAGICVTYTEWYV